MIWIALFIPSLALTIFAWRVHQLRNGKVFRSKGLINQLALRWHHIRKEQDKILQEAINPVDADLDRPRKAGQLKLVASNSTDENGKSGFAEIGLGTRKRLAQLHRLYLFDHIELDQYKESVVAEMAEVEASIDRLNDKL